MVGRHEVKYISRLPKTNSRKRDIKGNRFRPKRVVIEYLDWNALRDSEKLCSSLEVSTKPSGYEVVVEVTRHGNNLGHTTHKETMRQIMDGCLKEWAMRY